MVQIINAPTSRQRAWQNTLEQAASNFGEGLSSGYFKEKDTQRQQALAEQASNEKAAGLLMAGGYEVNPQNIMLARGKEVSAPVLRSARAAIPAQQAIPGQAESFRQPASMADVKQQEEGRLSQVLTSQRPGVEAVAARPEILGPKPTLTYTAKKQAEIDQKNKDSQQTRILRDAQIKDLQSKNPMRDLQSEKMRADINKTNAETGMLGNGGNKLDRKIIEVQAIDTAKKVSGLQNVKSAMDKAFVALQDPKQSEEQKIKTGQGLFKLLNSAEGSDAVGAEEAKRLGSMLEYQIFNITQPGSFIGRDVEGFTDQIKNYSDLIGERIKAGNESLAGLKQGALIGTNPPIDKEARIKELLLKKGNK